MTLRPYQQECVDAVERDLKSGFNRVGVMLPTGTGKTHIMTHFGAVWHKWGVIYVVHRDTLVEQTVKRLVATMPKGVSIGVVKGTRDEWHANVVVASIHTLRSPERRAFFRRRKFLACIVDEAHVSVSPTYLAVFEDMGAMRPGGTKLIGFSATWVRSDARGLADVWETISYERDIKWAIDSGFLVQPQGFQLGYDLDLSTIRQTAGDYDNADAAKAVMTEELQHSVVRGYRDLADGKSGVLFAPTVEASEFFAETLRANGIPAEGIYANVAAGKRRAIFERYHPRRGITKVLTTCVALAEGWDAPWCEVVLLCRPTRHVGLYVQQVGRALRPWEDPATKRRKTSALVLDFVGATDDKTLAAAIDLRLTPEKREPDQWDDDLFDTLSGDSDERVPMIKKIRGTHLVDLLGSASAQMLTTDKGVPFVIAGDVLLFVFEQPGSTWGVGRCPVRSMAGGEVVASGLDLETAIRRASAEAVGTAGALVRKTAGWRSSGETPTQRQIAHATSVGLDPAGLTKSQLADKLDVRQASRTLHDVWVRPVDTIRNDA